MRSKSYCGKNIFKVMMSLVDTDEFRDKTYIMLMLLLLI